MLKIIPPLLLAFALSNIQATSISSLETLPALQGAGTQFNLEQLPSSLWPHFVSVKDAEALSIKEGSRGTLIRVVEDQLLVDFGRNGLLLLDADRTDFLQHITDRISGSEDKEFPNLAMQIGNKLIRFDLGTKSGAIRFEKIEHKTLYVLLYLDQYSPDLAQDLLDFGAAYTSLEQQFPGIIAVLMPEDRKFYDFAATTGYQVPMITPHVRKGYMNSLTHAVDHYPALIISDANGKILAQKQEGIEKTLEGLLTPIGIDWEAPTAKSHTFSKKL